MICFLVHQPPVAGLGWGVFVDVEGDDAGVFELFGSKHTHDEFFEAQGTISADGLHKHVDKNGVRNCGHPLPFHARQKAFGVDYTIADGKHIFRPKVIPVRVIAVPK